MKPIEIGEAYNQLTHLWESNKFDIINGIEQHERAISFIDHRGYALDVGCGCTGRFIDLLESVGFSIVGVDISEKMINLAKINNPNTEFFHEDICNWLIPQKYDFITAWDSIWHIPLEQQKNVLTKLILSLNPNGVFIFSCGGTENKGEHTDTSMGKEVYYSTLGVNGFLQLFIDLDCICRHFEYDQHPELHSFFIIQKK